MGGREMRQAMLRAELAARELARRRYADYLTYVHGDGWKRTVLSEYLAEQVQMFLVLSPYLHME